MATICIIPLSGAASREAEASPSSAIDQSLIPEANESQQASGLFIGKSAAMDTAGRKATVTLDAYAGGSITAKVTSMPTDIVLLLDVSKSMNKAVGIGSAQTRIEALKESVNNYIDKIYEDAKDKSMTHRLSILTFAGDTTSGSDLTRTLYTGESINAGSAQTRIDQIKRSVSSLTADGATFTGDAMGDAYEELMDEYSRDSNNHVVVLFTDGAPGQTEDWFSAHGSESDAQFVLHPAWRNYPSFGDSFVQANKAISNAQKMKDAGANVYVVGLGFDIDLTSSKWMTNEYLGKNASEFYSKLYNKNSPDIALRDLDNPQSTLAVDSGFAGDNRLETETQRFLEYVSSNISGVNSIVQNTAQAKSGYAFSANTADDLKKTFESIEPIGKPAIDLDASAQLRDYVTSDWKAPDFNTSVQVYEQKYLGNSTWATPSNITSDVDIAASNDESGFTVKGFDYKANFVSETPRMENGTATYGSRIVVQFSMDADECFEGGKKVPTNTSQSAIYRSSTTASVGDFPIPTVDVSTGPGCAPCDLSRVELPKGTDEDPINGCEAMTQASVRNGAAHEYAVIGGGDDGSENNGYSELLNSTVSQLFITDNPGVSLEWRFSAKDDAGTVREVGTYTVSSGSFDQGTWAWLPGAQKYLEGIGTHQVSIDLTSSNHSGKVQSWTAKVAVYVPAVTVADSDIKLGHDAPLGANMIPGYVYSESTNVLDGELANGGNEVYWTKRDARKDAARTDLAGESNLLTDEPSAQPVATFLEGYDPGRDLISNETIKILSSTTFQIKFKLTASNGERGPLAQSAPEETNPSGISRIIGGETTSVIYNVRDSHELNTATTHFGDVIGAPLATAETQNVPDPNKAAFTIYVIGKKVTSLPLTGGDGVGKAAVLISVGTLVFTGFLVLTTRSKRFAGEE